MKKTTKLTIPLFIASVLLSSQSPAANQDEIAHKCQQLGMEVLLLTNNHESEKCTWEVKYSGAALIGSANLVKAGDFKKGLTNIQVAESWLAKVANSPEGCAYVTC
ncbi:MAG: hypothetical protein H0U57_06170 [Tatlockia sp.]|nr:hypothetical protein [Tatlockia sp.]